MKSSSTSSALRPHFVSMSYSCVRFISTERSSPQPPIHRDRHIEPSPTTPTHLQARRPEAGEAVPLRERAQLAQALGGGGGEADLALRVFDHEGCWMVVRLDGQASKERPEDQRVDVHTHIYKPKPKPTPKPKTQKRLPAGR